MKDKIKKLIKRIDKRLEYECLASNVRHDLEVLKYGFERLVKDDTVQ